MYLRGTNASGPHTLLLLTGIQSAPRNRVGCSGEDFRDVSLGCSSFLWCGALGSLQHICMTCPASCLTKRGTRRHQQIHPFMVRRLLPKQASSGVSIPAPEGTSKTALLPPSADTDAPSAKEVHQAATAHGPGTPLGLRPRHSHHARNAISNGRWRPYQTKHNERDAYRTAESRARTIEDFSGLTQNGEGDPAYRS